MAKTADRNLLTIGALFIIIVVSVLLYYPASVLTQGWMVLATIILLFGFWLMVLAGMQRSNPVKYARGAFSYFGWGLLLAALAGAWFVYSVSWIYSLALILLVLAGLAIAAGLRRR
jgi:cobalamin synthase